MATEQIEPALTAAEFEKAYAERSKVTVEEIRAMGLYPIPCDCDSDLCEGWQMDWENRREREAQARRTG